jgi:LmbE family N-acetylglucosaminyl deacetylase
VSPHQLTPDDLGPTLAVWAHPDDETYLSGALLAALRDRDERVVCVTATRGEAADPDATDQQRSALAALRTRELEAAAAVLGIEEHVWLDLPDGGCADVDPGPVVTRLVGLADDMGARTILTFGPDGVTGHPDHRTVSAWVSAAAPVMRTRPRVLHAAFTPEEMEEYRDLNDSFDIYTFGQPRLCPAEELVVFLQLEGDALERKVEALLAQASQTNGIVEAIGRERYAGWVSREGFADPAE